MNKGMIYTIDGLKVVEYDDSYKFISDAVGGYIERIPVDKLDERHIDMWCNEEGKLLGTLKPLVVLSYRGDDYDFVNGNIAFTRCDDEGNTVTLTNDDIAFIREFFKKSSYMFAIDDEVGLRMIKRLEVSNG